MSTFTQHGREWTINVVQEWIDVTSAWPSPNERWTFTDAAGHAHHYDHGYPTLEEVIDTEHWCDGREGLYNHDEHMAVDASHFECRICREVIEPKMDPPYARKGIPGMQSATIEGRRSDGSEIEAWLTPDEASAVYAAADPDAADAAALALLDSLPNERIHSVTFGFS